MPAAAADPEGVGPAAGGAGLRPCLGAGGVTAHRWAAFGVWRILVGLLVPYAASCALRASLSCSHISIAFKTPAAIRDKCDGCSS